MTIRSVAVARVVETASLPHQSEAKAFMKMISKIGKAVLKVDEFRAHVGVTLNKSLPIQAIFETFQKRGYKVEQVYEAHLFASLKNLPFKANANIWWKGNTKTARKLSISFNTTKETPKSSKPQIKLSDILIIQENNRLDREWVRDLVQDYKDGDEPEPVLILKLTPTIRKQITEVRDFHVKENTEFKGFMPKGIEKSPKKAVLLDGNHRYWAALKAGLKSLPYDEVDDANDIVSMRYYGHL